jgi:hypothetical protein
MLQDYHPGQWVVYRRTKHTEHPGPRARRIHPAERGETYWYEVEKYWVVEQLREDGTIVLLTRRGKRHQVDAADPRLRPARWWERLWYRDRFPLQQPDAVGTPQR